MHPNFFEEIGIQFVPRDIGVEFRFVDVCHERTHNKMTKRLNKFTNREFEREWSNMIGYKMSSSLARVYTIARTSPVENFKHGWVNDMTANMTQLLARRS